MEWAGVFCAEKLLSILHNLCYCLSAQATSDFAGFAGGLPFGKMLCHNILPFVTATLFKVFLLC